MRQFYYYRKTHIESAPFHASTKVTELIRDVESIFTSALEFGNRAEAMKQLRVPPLEEKNSPIVAFRLGTFVGEIMCFFSYSTTTDFILGMLCLLFPALFAFATQLSTSKLGKPLAWHPAILLYRSTCLIIMHIIFIGINIYGWSLSGVNHILIFEIDPRHHLTYQRVLEIGTSLFVIWFLSFIGFILASYFDSRPFIQPFILVVLLVLFLINPLPIFYRQARFWLLKKLRRVFAAPFYPVVFGDFWLGDQLTSLELIFFDVSSFLCFYVSDRAWWSTDLTSPASRQGVFCDGWSSIFLQTFLLILPSWFRFAQCVRRYRDTKHASPHLINAGKYATGFLVAIANGLRRATIAEYDGRAYKNPFLYIWIVASIVGSTYKLIWDIKMDWGFFHKNAGSNKYLREQLVYSSKIYYYGAIVEDIIFRYIWTINIFIYFHEQSVEYSGLIGFCFGIVEIFRRFIWNFFRLENEHLNNCGQFRAVRDISISVMSTGIDYNSISYKPRKQPGIQRRRRIAPRETTIHEEITSITDTTKENEAENNTMSFHQYRNSTQDATILHDDDKTKKRSKESSLSDSLSSVPENDPDSSNEAEKK